MRREINTNKDRAARALDMLDAYADGEDRRTVDAEDAAELLGDVLCDLMHLFPKLDFQAALDRGAWHYREELAEAKAERQQLREDRVAKRQERAGVPS